MVGKPSNQPGFADLQASSRVNENHFLLRIDRGIDWRRSTTPVWADPASLPSRHTQDAPS